MLATAPKSNTGYVAINTALSDIRMGKGKEFPSHLQSPLFTDYIYHHDYANDYVPQQYLPNDIKDTKYYEYGNNKTEQAAKAYWDVIKNMPTKKKKD